MKGAPVKNGGSDTHKEGHYMFACDMIYNVSLAGYQLMFCL